MSPILKLFYSQTKKTNELPEKFKFTKKNFIENFIVDDN